MDRLSARRPRLDRLALRRLLRARRAPRLLACLGLAGLLPAGGCGGGAAAPTPTPSPSSPPAALGVARADYGAPLELRGQVLHGGGQDLVSFAAYSEALAPSRAAPIVYMAYLDLKEAPTFFDGLAADLDGLEAKTGTYYVPQIGLAMTTDGQPSSHYEQDVAAGLHDVEIDALARGLIGLGRPVLLRIGYECNGVSWNGYQPDSYRAAFARIAGALRAAGVEVATVWNVAGEEGTLGNVMDYYPGDEWVDWWSVNTFSRWAFSSAEVSSLLDEADRRGKPVLIGESTPRWVGVLNGAASWDAWFEDYFRFIEARRGLKGISYIDWDWSRYPKWVDWGDCRIERNPEVLLRFAARVSSSLFANAMDERALRAALLRPPVADLTPAGVLDLEGTFSASTVALRWSTEPADASPLRFEIERDSQRIGRSRAAAFVDWDPIAAATLRYAVRAIARDGSAGEASNAVSVTLPNHLERTHDGSFEEGRGRWALRTFNGAAGDFGTGASTLGQGSSAHVGVTVATDTNWHIQLVRPVKVHAGRAYTLHGRIRATRAVTATVFLQQAHEPYGSVLVQDIPCTPAVGTFSAASGTVASDDSVYLTFMFGGLGQNEYELDDVSLVESRP